LGVDAREKALQVRVRSSTVVVQALQLRAADYRASSVLLMFL